jgi:hypothetical protein
MAHATDSINNRGVDPTQNATAPNPIHTVKYPAPAKYR